MGTGNAVERFAAAPRSPARNAVFVLAGSALLALGAQISLPVPFSPVPITGQTLALPLVVALLGTRSATLAAIVYLAEGAAGLPVFAPTGQFYPGFAAFFGPTGGYLVAFPLAAFVTGWLFDRGLWNGFASRALAILTGSILVLAGGAAWLAHFTGANAAFTLGVAPFVLGDFVKTLVAAALAPWLRKSGGYSSRSSIDTL
jgi:biotin transport system substrate-specific component